MPRLIGCAACPTLPAYQSRHSCVNAAQRANRCFATTPSNTRPISGASQSSKESDKSPTPASTSCTTSSRHASSHICPNAALRQQQTCIQSRSCCLLVTPAAAAPAPCCPPEHDLAISMEELPSPLDSRSRSSLAADAAAAAAAAA